MPKKRKIEYHVQVASSQLIFLSYWKFAYIQGSYKNKNQVIGQMTERNRRIDVCFNILDLKSHDMNSLKINYGSSKIKYQWLPVKKFTMPNHPSDSQTQVYLQVYSVRTQTESWKKHDK